MNARFLSQGKTGRRPLLKTALALTFVIGALACGAAWAGLQQAAQPAPAALPVCTLDPSDSSKLAVEPCRAPPPVQPRRSVSQTIERMPTQMPKPVYGFHAASQPSGFSAPSAPVAPSAPLPVNSCDTGGCRDASGMRHDGGIGNATLDANGHICHRNGVWLQCF